MFWPFSVIGTLIYNLLLNLVIKQYKYIKMCQLFLAYYIN